MWAANIDIQFVGEPSLVLNRYITRYITKPEKNRSEEIWKAIDENKSLGARLRVFARQNLISRETGSYEALDKILGHKCFYSSDAVQYLSTSMKKDRRRKLKSHHDLVLLAKKDARSTEIYCRN